MRIKTKKLINYYERICNLLVRKFCKKQRIEFDYWIAGRIGEMASFNEEYFFNLNDILYDLKTNQPKRLIFRWQDHCVSAHFKNKKRNINYYAYSRGLRA